VVGGLLWVNVTPPLDPLVGRAADEVGEIHRPPWETAALAPVAALVMLSQDATFSVFAPAAAHFCASRRSFFAAPSCWSRAGERSRSVSAWLSWPYPASQR
jgi:hypothetical protein